MQPDNPRKRPNPEESSTERASKKHENWEIKNWEYRHPPPAFWVNLSEIHFTASALRELNRRNARERLSSRRPDPPPVAVVPAAQYLHNCTRQTRGSVKRASRHGGPDLSDLRGCPEPSTYSQSAMSAGLVSSGGQNSSAVVEKERMNRMSAYDRNFLQHLIDHGVYPWGYDYPDPSPEPANWEEMQERLARHRPSIPPAEISKEKFEAFRAECRRAPKEKHVYTLLVATLEGASRDAGYVSGGIPFNNLDPLTNGTIVSGSPDFYSGARPVQLKRGVRDELNRFIIPSTQDNLPIVPNFYLEVKGPNGVPTVAEAQALYDGALGARGMHRLQSYGRRSAVPDGNAYTITSTYSHGTLTIFTTTPSLSPETNRRPEYFAHLLGAWSMIGSVQGFQQAITAWRNMRDWAREQREEAIRDANERFDREQGHAAAVDVNVSVESVVNDKVAPDLS